MSLTSTRQQVPIGHSERARKVSHHIKQQKHRERGRIPSNSTSSSRSLQIKLNRMMIHSPKYTLRLFYLRI